MFKHEFRKMITPLTLISIVGLLIVSSILTLTYVARSRRAMLSDGTPMYNDITAYRKIEAETKFGELNQQYLDNFSTEFANTLATPDFDSNKHYLYRGISQYAYTNRLINFAYYGPGTLSNMQDLNFEFMNSDKDLHDAYKNSVLKAMQENKNSKNMYYNIDELQKIEKYINNLKTPFVVG
ncbi:MAG: hypothetical protein ATN31_05690 [Candidatus Epulonipiscioides saccharophilum]|nr:MAG: hypothetical protein ATN31_05690 [Epulopiscium sp. AS2M-Bin001]